MSIYGSTGMQLALTGQYALSPVGLDAETTCAALRARVSRMTESDLYLPMPAGPEAADDVPLTVGLVPNLDTDLQGIDRLLSLALGALRGLVDRAQMARGELGRTATDAVPSTWNLEQTFLPSLVARAGMREIKGEWAAIDQSGHTGVFALLGKATALLDSGEVDQCIVLAVDSYIDLERLHALDLAYRLKSERGVDGFVPGEAAVALLLERAVPRSPTRRPCLCRVTLPVLATEPRPFLGDKPSGGTGLATVLRGALRSMPQAQPASWVLCDLNGESYRAFEWGLVRVRLASQLASPIVVQHPADCVGDTGAAAGGLLLACAAQAFVRKYAQAQAALVWAASDAGARAATLVLPPEGSS